MRSTKIIFAIFLVFFIHGVCKAAFSKSSKFPTIKNDNVVKCYDNFGCFPNDGIWASSERSAAINTHPESPEQIHPKFRAYKIKNLNQSISIEINYPDSMRHLKIHDSTRLFFLTHGYLESGHKPWILEMANALLHKYDEHNVLVVIIDWSGGSSPPYVQAAVNIRIVGAMTAYLIYSLYKIHNLSTLDNVHLIGHSLGAHLMGYCGSHLQQNYGLKVKRISGLDPAAPLFSETDPLVRLDNTDAHFVDVIHSDISPFINGGLGINQAVGHVDFYPNGGSDNPGCDMQFTEYMRNIEHNVFSNMQEFLSCNHLRSHQFYIESIKTNCPFLGITCKSYDDFKAVHCSHCDMDGNLCIPMGYNSYKRYKELTNSRRIHRNKSLMLFLTTGDRAPFCRVHYKITVRVSGNDESQIQGAELGSLSINIHGSNTSDVSAASVHFNEKSMLFEPGFKYTALVPGKEIINPSYATVYWEHDMSLFNLRIMLSPRIYLDYILIESLETNNFSLKLCTLNNLPVISGSATVFKANYCKHNT